MRSAYAFLLLVLCVVSSSHAQVPLYNTSIWMQQMGDKIYSRSLLDITLPGTHDSGAYEFGDVLSPIDPELVADLIKIAYDLDIDIYTFIKNWSQTQDTTIYEQLMGGIRYLDLRACFIQNDWYTQHFLVGTRTQDLLNDIQAFMLESPGEVLVVELGELIPEDQELLLINMFQATLGPWLAPRMDLNETTVGEMVKNQERIVLLYPETNFTSNFTFLWNKTLYMEGSYANKDKLDDMETWNVQQINTLGGHGMIFELSWTLTTQDSDIIKTLLDPFARKEDLRDFALTANAALDGWQQQYSNYMMGNILLLDWWEYSNVVELTIAQNLRMCGDDPKYIAVKEDGQYCRHFYLNGNCTEPDYKEWMSVHCRLSCGYC
jgi:hypothetical protein